MYKYKPMLTQKINKRISSEDEKYKIYLGILQAISGFKIADQEKLILSTIMKEGELTKNVKTELELLASKARIENVICKFRKNKILIGNKLNAKFPKFGEGDVVFNITLKNEGNK